MGTSPPESPVEAPPSLEVVESFGRDIDVGEIDRLLDLAEEIHQRIERLVRRSVVDFLMLGGAIGTIMVTVYFFGVVALPPWLPYVASGLVGLLLGVSMSGLIQKNRGLLRSGQSLREVLDIVREVEQTLVSTSKVRPLTRARIRIRMSQFGLSPHKSSFPLVRAIFRGGL